MQQRQSTTLLVSSPHQLARVWPGPALVHKLGKLNIQENIEAHIASEKATP